MKDAITIKGRVRIVIANADGTSSDEWTGNLVVAAGRNLAASRMKDASATPMSHVGVGSGQTPPAAGNTALQAQTIRKAATISLSQASLSYAVVFNPGEIVGEISEAGLFNAASAGDMMSRVVFHPRNVLPTSSVSITWLLAFS
jgi:hypothetical protein